MKIELFLDFKEAVLNGSLPEGLLTKHGRKRGLFKMHYDDILVRFGPGNRNEVEVVFAFKGFEFARLCPRVRFIPGDTLHFSPVENNGDIIITIT